MTKTAHKQNYSLVPYQIDDTKILKVTQTQDSVWLTQKQMAELFGCDRRTVGQHLINIFESQELDKNEVCQKIWHTTEHGAIKGKTQVKAVNHYNLDAIISVGYRVNSKRGVMFRQWATKVIKEKLKQQYEQKNAPKQIPANKEWAKEVNNLLRQKGITKKQIAKEIGLTNVTVCKTINGKVKNPIVLNWIEVNLFPAKENSFIEKSKALFDEAMQGSYEAFKKVRKILKTTAAIHNFI